jgi:hypothetical protein
MGDVGVDERVSEERPHIRAEPTGKQAGEDARLVAPGNEGEQPQEAIVLLGGEPIDADHVHEA